MTSTSKQPSLEWKTTDRAERDPSSLFSILVQVEKPTVSGFLTALKECSCSRHLERGKHIHSFLVSSGFSSNTYLLNSLIHMYGKCSCMAHARNVFDIMHRRDVVSWNTLIQGYVENGECQLALELYDRIAKGEDACVPDSRTYVAALTACSNLAAPKSGKLGRASRTLGWSRWLEKGEEVHSNAVKSYCSNTFVENVLISMYAQAGSMNQAQAVFDRMAKRDVVSWNSLLQGYVENGDCELPLELFGKLLECRDSGVYPNERTFLCAVSACAACADRATSEQERRDVSLRGESVHSLAVASHCCDVYVETALVDMYSKCGDMIRARTVFDGMSQRTSASWCALLQGYVENGQSFLALKLFETVRGGFVPDARVFLVAVKACAALVSEQGGNLGGAWLEKAREIHLDAKRSRSCDLFVETAVMEAYVRGGDVAQARSIFNEMAHRDVLAWNCLIQGYVSNQRSDLALEILAEMKNSTGVSPNSATFIAALMACGDSMALQLGKGFHSEIERRGFGHTLSTYLVDLYGKCGSIDSSMGVFESTPVKDIWSWNAVILGYSQQGDTTRVFELFGEMKRGGVSPDGFTFTHILTACSHAGLTDKARECFSAMQAKYGAAPDLIQYTCMVDLLARGNLFEEALGLVKTMPFEPDFVLWTVVLDASWKWRDCSDEDRSAGKGCDTILERYEMCW